MFPGSQKRRSYSPANELEELFSPISSEIPHEIDRDWSSCGFSSTPFRPVSTITTASTNSSGSVESSGSSGRGSITNIKPVILLNEMKERGYSDQHALIAAQKEISDLKKQLKESKLQLLKVLGSETDASAVNISKQGVDLENTALNLKLLEITMSKEREAQIMKSNLSEMQAKYENALNQIGKESEVKTKQILNLEDREFELKQQLNEKEEENRILRAQVSNLHSTFVKQNDEISNSHAQNQSKWIGHFEKQNVSIMNLQEKIRMDGRNLAILSSEKNKIESENTLLRSKLEEEQRKSKSYEAQLQIANERTELELANMRLRHKQKYGQSLKTHTDEITNLKASLKSLENDHKRCDTKIIKLEDELERTKALKSVVDQPYLFDSLYTKIQECVNEFQTIFSYLQSLGGNETDSLNLSKDFSLTQRYTNPEDRIKQLGKIHSRLKEYHEHLQEKYVSNFTQECNIQ